MCNRTEKGLPFFFPALSLFHLAGAGAAGEDYPVQKRRFHNGLARMASVTAVDQTVSRVYVFIFSNHQAAGSFVNHGADFSGNRYHTVSSSLAV